MSDWDAWSIRSRERFVHLYEAGACRVSFRSATTHMATLSIRDSKYVRLRTMIRNEAQNVRDRLLALEHLLRREDRALEHWQRNLLSNAPAIDRSIHHDTSDMRLVRHLNA